GDRRRSRNGRGSAGSVPPSSGRPATRSRPSSQSLAASRSRQYRSGDRPVQDGSLRSGRDSLRMAEYAALFLLPRMLDGTVGCCFGSVILPPIANLHERLVLGLVNMPLDEGFHIGCAVHASKTSLATRAAI